MGTTITQKARTKLGEVGQSWQELKGHIAKYWQKYLLIFLLLLAVVLVAVGLARGCVPSYVECRGDVLFSNTSALEGRGATLQSARQLNSSSPDVHVVLNDGQKFWRSVVNSSGAASAVEVPSQAGVFTHGVAHNSSATLLAGGNMDTFTTTTTDKNDYVSTQIDTKYRLKVHAAAVHAGTPVFAVGTDAAAGTLCADKPEFGGALVYVDGKHQLVDTKHPQPVALKANSKLLVVRYASETKISVYTRGRAWSRDLELGEPVADMALSDDVDVNHVWVVDGQGKLQGFNADTGAKLASLPALAEKVASVAVTPDTGHVIVAGLSGAVYSNKTWESGSPWKTHSEKSTAALNRTGVYMFTGNDGSNYVHTLGCSK